MTFAYRLGATVYNQTLATKVEGGNPRENADRRVFYDRWKQPGDMAKYKNIASREVTPVTDRFVAKEYALDGSSLKVSYTLPQNWITRIHLRRAMVSLSTGDLSTGHPSAGSAVWTILCKVIPVFIITKHLTA